MKRILGIAISMMVLGAPAYALRASVGLGAGGGHMPMSEYKDFVTNIKDATYSPDRIALNTGFVARFALADHHVLRLSLEHISMGADWFHPSEGFLPSSIASVDFTTVPIGVAYEYCFSGFDSGASPFVAVGSSIYVSTFKGALVSYWDVLETMPAKRTGNGFGVEGLVGQRAAVNDRISIVAQVRGRWADAFLFSDKDGDIKIEASGVDVSVYGEWRFR